MRAVRAALNDLIDVLALAVEPRQVEVDDEAADADRTEDVDGRIMVLPLSLDRVGRSRRDGPVLDLQLVAAVRCTGPEALDSTELMLQALERRPQVLVEPMPRELGPARSIGFVVRLPVAVRLDEQLAPPVTEPLDVRARVVRAQRGRLLDRSGRPVAGARIWDVDLRSDATTDESGRFRLLVGATASEHELRVEVDDSRYDVRAADLGSVVIDRERVGS